MRREPAITFKGALRILGRDEPAALKAIDAVLGGVILGSGLWSVTGLFGLVDQKKEATGLLGQLLRATTGRLTRTGGLSRYQLVISAHTVLVVSAVFDTLGREFTDREKLALITDSPVQAGGSVVRGLYEAEVPCPSAEHGFTRTADLVQQWALTTMQQVRDFFDGDLDVNKLSFLRAVTDRYRSDYLAFAEQVPEFKVWADLTEHSATQHALHRLETLLTAPGARPQDLRGRLANVNRAELDRPVVDVDDGFGIDAVFPRVSEIFLTPDSKTGPVDLILARHFTTADATRVPLLLLGNPGSGKSLLMKVLAARLPDTTYTVVRVPLRRVEADDPIAAQVDQALRLSTNGSVTWNALSDQCDDTIRVVLLDGLDELLQATATDRRNYLHDVVRFQETEAALGRPVAVVVTSRTLVINRVRTPDGCPVVELLPFDRHQITEWIRIWNEVNGSLRPVDPDTVLEQWDLAREPLLLLMLCLYLADPANATTDLSQAILYERLLDSYARREVARKRHDDSVRSQLVRLSIAALGMFNRGRQWITEDDLTTDLTALREPTTRGERLLGEFFFVYANEAVAGSVHRSYEFLHATFAEYLVAARVTEVLRDVAEGAFLRRHEHDPEDDLLFSLLSHRYLGGQDSLIRFLDMRMATWSGPELTAARKTLDLLISGHRQRQATSRYGYQPTPPDTIRALAAYSVNLLLLRMLFGPLRLFDLWPSRSLGAWRAMVSAWESGLDPKDFSAVLTTITLGQDRGPVFVSRPVRDRYIDLARLRGELALEQRQRFGRALLDFTNHAPLDNDWPDFAASWLGLLSTGCGTSRLDFTDARVPDSVPVKVTSALANHAYTVFAVHSPKWSYDHVLRYAKWMVRLRTDTTLSPHALRVAETAHAGLLTELAGWKRMVDPWPALLDTAQRLEDQSDVAEYLASFSADTWTALLEAINVR
ncbi:NACHT domain-containing protein [Actinokineospora inagensis]|uniref:NACHT domain-containing protein n=1 Tax=Actinokineospora inagensis TaxID=103730 RepID=UPI00040FD9DA|nr:ATP-binding protein [Actinokineospora inagensis]